MLEQLQCLACSAAVRTERKLAHDLMVVKQSIQCRMQTPLTTLLVAATNWRPRSVRTLATKKWVLRHLSYVRHVSEMARPCLLDVLLQLLLHRDRCAL